MLLKCIVIDKEPSAIEVVTKYIQCFPALKLLQTFEDVITGGEFLRSNSIDILFIELGMPANAAIRLVQSLSQKLMVIFTVACKQVTPDVLKLEALDYLVKPFTLERFARSIEKTHAPNHEPGLLTSAEDSIYLRSTYQLIKIVISEIEYIEGVENYIKIHLAHDKPVMTLMSLKLVLEKLPPGKFIRIHRSYIIPVDKIRYIGNRKIKLTSAELPVSDSHLLSLKLLLKK